MTSNTKTKSKKTYLCDSCQQIKEGNFAQGSYVKRLVDAPFEPKMHKRVCYICPSCQPYVKEYNEAQDRDKDNDPHKQF